LTIYNLTHSCLLFLSISQGWYFLNDGTTIYYGKGCYSYSDISLDPYWKTAAAFSIIAAVVGGVACIVSCVAQCGQGFVGNKVLALIFMFSALCQGLCFLFLKSDACSGIDDLIPESESASVSCDLSWGANITIAATVLWFVAGVSMCFLSRQEAKADDDMGPDAEEEPVEE
jgi:hypothetical protein